METGSHLYLVRIIILAIDKEIAGLSPLYFLS